MLVLGPTTGSCTSGTVASIDAVASSGLDASASSSYMDAGLTRQPRVRYAAVTMAMAMPASASSAEPRVAAVSRKHGVGPLSRLWGHAIGSGPAAVLHHLPKKNPPKKNRVCWGGPVNYF